MKDFLVSSMEAKYCFLAQRYSLDAVKANLWRYMCVIRLLHLRYISYEKSILYTVSGSLPFSRFFL